MIFTDRTIIVQKGASSIDEPIVLYRGDKEVEIRFTLNESFPFRFGSGANSNIIEKTEAAYGQLIIKTPNGLPSIFSDVAPTKKGQIVFKITAEMIDEVTEVGKYTFQIRLLDEGMNARVTLPEVNDGIEIREPIATEDVSTTNEVGAATVGYALTTAGTTEDAFDTQGNYIKTNWATGNRITAEKLNKIEAGIDGVNQKVASGGTGGQGLTVEQSQQLSTAYQHSQTTHVQASDIPTKTSQLTNDSSFVNETYVTNAINNAQLGGGGSGSNNASDISIADTANNFTSTNVEGALQEVGSQIKELVNGGGATNVPENVALVMDINVDGTTEDYIPIMSANGAEYKLTISNAGVPIVKDVNGNIVFTCGTGGSSGGGDNSVPCTGITLDRSVLEFTTSDTQTLTATVTPSNCTQTVIWTTSLVNVATVSNGVITPVANGDCIITATCGDYSATCNVTVSISSSGDFVSGQPYTLKWTDGMYINSSNGVEVTNELWSATQYIPIYGVDYIKIDRPNGTNEYNAFYDSDKKFIQNISLTKSQCREYVPSNAAYLRISCQTTEKISHTITPYKLPVATWTNGVAYDLGLINNHYYNSASLVAYDTWSATQQLNCVGASKLIIKGNTSKTTYCYWLTDDKTAYFTATIDVDNGSGIEINVPNFACYFLMSNTTTAMENVTITPYK